MKLITLILAFTLGLTSVASAGFHDKKSAAVILQNGKIIHHELTEILDRRINKRRIVNQFYVTMDMIAYRCWITNNDNAVECFELDDLGVSSKRP